MVWSLFSSSALFAVAVQAMAHPGPRATGAAAIPLDARSPKPTTPPALHQFLRRQNGGGQTVLVAPDNTCGFLSGQSAAAYTCVEKTALCVFVTVVEGSAGTTTGAAGCCNERECGFRIACLDYNQISTSSLCNSDCMSETLTEKCTATTAPFCNTIAFGNGVTDYFCHSRSISTAQRADTTFSGQTGRSFAPTVLPGISTPHPPTSGTTTTSGTSAATTTVQPAAASSSTPVGAIVGGVVGGVAVIGLLGLGAWFVKRHGNTPSSPANETQQLNSNGPPPAALGPLSGAPSSDVRPGHQSLMSQYSNVSPFNSPPPNQTHFSTQSQQSGYYPPPSFDQATMVMGGAYGSDRQTTSSQLPTQGYGPPGPMRPGEQPINPGVPAELGGTAKRGPVHELM